MSDTNELIVQFRRGVSEDDARSKTESAGGTVRRRMRSDHDDQVMLLVKTEDVDGVKAKLDALGDVTHTEVNSGGYSVQN